MPEREQIISFLLAQCDAKNEAIKGLQQQIADLQKQSEPKAAQE